jgi:phosphohistidine phosphatase SixA
MNLVSRLTVLLVVCLAPFAACANDAIWKLLQGGGQVVLVRHALTTPGVGDPEGMTLSDCATQRNLSAQGREDARKLGDELRRRDVPIGAILSSPWCRCIETSRLLLGREPEIEPALGNVFGRPEQGKAQVATLREIASRTPRSGNTLMLTHGSTILALTGISPDTSEMVIATPRGNGQLVVVGRLLVR